MIRLPVSILIIAEGYEEEAYLKKLFQFPCFSRGNYTFIVKNANGNGNIAPRYQDEYSKNRYDLILVFCDGDNNSEQYREIVEDICVGIFNDRSLEDDLIVFANPVTLQIVLSHFGEVKLTHVAKKKNAKEVKLLTGIDNYDAEEGQVNAMVEKIFYRSYKPMKDRIKTISTSVEESPSTNFLRHLEQFERSDTDWVETLIRRLNDSGSQE